LNAYPDARWVALKFVFEFIDQQANKDAAPSVSGEDAISQLPQVLDGVFDGEDAFTILEHNRWGLSRDFKPLPDDYSTVQTGWVSSEQAGSDGVFTREPYLEFTFSEAHSSIGFTLHFEKSTGAHSNRLSVVTFGADGSVITRADVVNHSAVCVINLLTPNYTRVRFTFHEMSRPFSRLRISQVVFGIIETFANDSISQTSLEYELDPVADSLPSRKAVFKIDNSDRRFDLINPRGIYAYLQQPQSFHVYMGVGETRKTIEYAAMGSFYFTTASAEDSGLTAEITAYDWFYWMDKTTYSNAAAGEWTLAEAVPAILQSAGITCDVSIPGSSAAVKLNKVKDSMSHREALRLAVQAACCTAYFDRTGTFVVLDLASGTPTGALDSNNMSAPPKVTIDQKVNSVELSATDAATGTEVVYTASNVGEHEMVQKKSVTNNMVHSTMGQKVADWLLLRSQSRLTYHTFERGDPSVELADTVRIYDYFGVNRNAVIIKQELTFDGGLKAESEAITVAAT
jgi:hypothetical protein